MRVSHTGARSAAQMQLKGLPCWLKLSAVARANVTRAACSCRSRDMHRVAAVIHTLSYFPLDLQVPGLATQAVHKAPPESARRASCSISEPCATSATIASVVEPETPLQQMMLSMMNIASPITSTTQHTECSCGYSELQGCSRLGNCCTANCGSQALCSHLAAQQAQPRALLVSFELSLQYECCRHGFWQTTAVHMKQQLHCKLLTWTMSASHRHCPAYLHCTMPLTGLSLLTSGVNMGLLATCRHCIIRTAVKLTTAVCGGSIVPIADGCCVSYCMHSHVGDVRAVWLACTGGAYLRPNSRPC